MTDPRVGKLAKQGVSQAVAETLVAAGFDRPGKIRKALKKDLDAVIGRGERLKMAVKKGILRADVKAEK